MAWRKAYSLDVLLAEVNAAAPRRSKASDGFIGDAAHATRSSDHNPWITVAGTGVVRAGDFTHDPAGGMDAGDLADQLATMIRAGSHPALRAGSYLIWNRRILSYERRVEGWRRYTGSNAHTKHVHVSVSLAPSGFDSRQPWRVLKVAAKPDPGGIDVTNVRDQFLAAAEGRPVDTLPGVKRIQELLNLRYQAGLDTDGYVGEATLNAYGRHETAVGVVGRPRVPDTDTLTELVKGTGYWLVQDEPAPAPKPEPKPSPAPPPPKPAPAPAPVKAAAPDTFRHIRCNVQQTDPESEAEAHIDWVAAQGDLIGWNELGRAWLVDKVRNLPGFTTYAPGTDRTSAAVAISWRSDLFELIDSATMRLHGGALGITPSRHVNTVRLRHKPTGRTFWALNTHTVHRVESRGVARTTDLLPGQVERAQIAFPALAKVTASLPHALCSGDLNVDLFAEQKLSPDKRTPWFPYTMLSAVSTVHPPPSGTHGNRAIDWLWTRGRVAILEQTVLPKRTSDHHPVLSVVTFT